MVAQWARTANTIQSCPDRLRPTLDRVALAMADSAPGLFCTVRAHFDLRSKHLSCRAIWMCLDQGRHGGESGVGLNRQGSGDRHHCEQKGDVAAMTYDAERSIVVLELCANASLLVRKRDSQCVGAANTSRRPAGFLVNCKKRETG